LPHAVEQWQEAFMPLDFAPLTRAIGRLEEGLDRHRADPADSQLRDGLIQRFEFTYDLAHKMLRRALEAAAANPEEIDRMSFPTLIRTGFKQGMLASDWTHWRLWREMRNITSHTYDETKAMQVAGAIPEFLAEALALLHRLESGAAA
jgi:nucleotidyltransferase substrate binding protein (TIGR01987 family)